MNILPHFILLSHKKRVLKGVFVLQTEFVMKKLKLELETTNFTLGLATPCCSGKPNYPVSKVSEENALACLKT